METEESLGTLSTPPLHPHSVEANEVDETFEIVESGAIEADENGVVVEIDHASGRLTKAPPATNPTFSGKRRIRGQKIREKILCVGKSGDVTFFAHLSCMPVECQTLARMMVGIYDDKIRRRALADRESFVLVSAEALGAAEPGATTGETLRSIGVQRAALRLIGIRHMAFYVKPCSAQKMFTEFLALCETITDDGGLEYVDASWSDDFPDECLAYTTINKNALRPFELHSFVSLVAGNLGRYADSSISWHPSTRFIRHFDPEIWRG